MTRSRGTVSSPAKSRLGGDVATGTSNWVGEIFTQAAAHSDAMVAKYFPMLAKPVIPIAALIAMIWVGVKVVRIHAGRDPADVWPMIRIALTILLIFAGLQGGGLVIYHMFSQLRDDTLHILMTGKSIAEYVNDVNDQISVVSGQLMSQSFLNIGIVFVGTFIEVMAVLLTVIVLFLNVASIMGLAITTTIGPLFLPTLFWDMTRGFGMSWFAAQAKFALVGILLGICVAFSFDLSLTFLTSHLKALNGAGTKIVLADATAVIVLQGFMCAFCLFNVKPLAGALASSGAAAGGIADMAAGMFVSNILSKVAGGGRGTGTRGAGGGSSIAQLANTQTDMQKQLARIEWALTRSGGGSGSSSSSMQSEPSGAGQPGTTGNATRDSGPAF